ncbi:ATP-binding protein [Actinosynnema sp. NPDC020468]|uniref:ATP-binding protein n=1 Tax=Actinosynnema sp. NPDC020468 TaxID=3154488 RepID=UPI0033EC08A8
MTGRAVRCPVCADRISWEPGAPVSVWDVENSRYETVRVTALAPEKRADLERLAYRQCPNPSGDTAAHYLPATYADHGEPLVIGLVGAPASGKTHLLTAMIRQIHLDGLGAHGITAAPLDFRRHRDFHDDYVRKFEAGGTLSGTDTGVVEAADILLLRGPTGARPVSFFDVAGEDLEDPEARNRATKFLAGTTAVVFVHGSEDPLDTGRPTPRSENRSFHLAVERLLALPDGARLPAVIAVTKSDRLRYVPPADRWLHRGDERTVDAARIRAESRDVFAYLHHVGAGASLRPFEAFTRCALHFVSASGGDAKPVDRGDPAVRHFPRGFRPTRVLEPLVSILAMTGMIAGAEAERVGAP